MKAIEATVQNRRIEVPAPDDWPDGTKVKVVPVPQGNRRDDVDFMTEEEQMDNSFALLEEAFGVWAKQEVVHAMPTMYGEPISRFLVEEVAGCVFGAPREYKSTFHDCLLALLGHPNPMIPAHVLMALRLSESPALGFLPEQLCGRNERLVLECGTGSYSVRSEMTLGEFAKFHRLDTQPAEPDATAGGEA